MAFGLFWLGGGLSGAGRVAHGTPREMQQAYAARQEGLHLPHGRLLFEAAADAFPYSDHSQLGYGFDG